MPPERYALIRDGVLIWGPGPLPHVINLENGDLFEVAAYTPEQRRSVGLLPVEQRGWREIDPEIEQAETPAFAIEQGRPVEIWSYRFTPGARAAMRHRIDEQAEAVRREHISAAPGQVMEYEAAVEEAWIVAALPPEEPIAPGRFPFLEADIGVTDLAGAGRTVDTLREAAAAILGASKSWRQAGARIRAWRLAAKAAIATAATDAEAFQVFREAVSARP